MEIHQVRYFVAVSKLLNFTRAAEVCHVTQPALTKAIQKLEGELGGALLFRERQLTQLTELGKLVLPMLESLLAAAEAARSSARDFKHKMVAPLRIGLSSSISASLIVDLLAEILRVAPDLRVDLVEIAGENITRQLLDGDLNAVFACHAGTFPDRIDHWRLFEEQLVVLMPSSAALAQRAVAPLNLLKDQVWLERIGCEAIQDLWRTRFSGEHAPRIRHRGRQEAHLQQMVAAGLGLLLAPEHAPLGEGVTARPIEGHPLHRQVELMVMAGRRYTPALDALIKLTRGFDWARRLDQSFIGQDVSDDIDLPLEQHRPSVPIECGMALA